MNCKPGDLAMVIKGKKSSGLIVRVLRAAKNKDITKSKCGEELTVECGALPVWHLEGFVYRKASDGRVLLVPLVNDRDLRRIDNPGEDSTDEMVQLVGKPVANPEGVPA